MDKHWTEQYAESFLKLNGYPCKMVMVKDRNGKFWGHYSAEVNGISVRTVNYSQWKKANR